MQIMSIEEAPRSPWTLYLMFCTLVASISSLLFGYNISVIDAPRETFKNCSFSSNSSFPPCIPTSTLEWALVVSVMCLGALSGSLIAGQMADRLGRRRSILLNNAFYFIGLCLLALSVNYGMMVAGRFITGIAVGITTVVVPLFLTEIASDSIRGSIGTFHQLSCVIGILVAQLVGMFLKGNDSWRWLFWIPVALSSLQSVLLIWVCESPKYLIMEGGVEGAKLALARLRGAPVLLDFEGAADEGKGSKKYLSLWDLFFHTPRARKSLITGIVMHLGQQLCGINAVFYFSTSFFTGFSIDPTVITTCLGVMNLLITIVSIWLIEKLGRRFLLLFSTVSMFASCILLTISMITEFSVGRVLCIYLFVASFSIGIGPVSWLILNEIFLPEAISGAVAVAVSLNWLSNFVVGMTFEKVAEALGNFTFLPFAGILAAFFVYSLLIVPETKGRPVAYL